MELRVENNEVICSLNLLLQLSLLFPEVPVLAAFLESRQSLTAFARLCAVIWSVGADGRASEGGVAEVAKNPG